MLHYWYQSMEENLGSLVAAGHQARYKSRGMRSSGTMRVVRLTSLSIWVSSARSQPQRQCPGRIEARLLQNLGLELEKVSVMLLGIFVLAIPSCIPKKT